MGDLSHGQSEDCLSLTVWTPAVDGPGRPVLLWLHGGAFLSGGGAVDWYDGSNLCREGDTVVVSPNYRLGALGFLHSPGISQGNLGLLDAEQALTWVRENIAQFGGDPNRITVMGQSAGAWLAALLVARMPADKPTIRGLILHSAPLGIMPSSPDTAAIVAREFLHQLGTGPGETDGATAVRTADAVRILSAQDAAIRAIAPRITTPGYPAVPFGPVLDAQVLPCAADYRQYLAQAAGRVPVLVGWTRDEMNAFSPPPVHGAVGANNNRIAAEIFSNPALQWAASAQDQGHNAFVFCLDWAAPGNPVGACHCIDLPFVFGTLQQFAAAPMLQGAAEQEMQALSGRMRIAWLAFIRHGDPNNTTTGGLPAWPKFSAQAPMVMHIDVHSTTRRTPIANVSSLTENPVQPSPFAESAA